MRKVIIIIAALILVLSVSWAQEPSQAQEKPPAAGTPQQLPQDVKYTNDSVAHLSFVEGKSMLLVFNYVDTLHFYYTHLSVDPGAKVDVHNGIFLVDGAPRRRIAGTEAAPALPDTNWHKVRVQRDVSSGSIEVLVDDELQPRFSVLDNTFKCGQTGLGSFDETGDFTDVKLSSEDAGCHS